MSGEWAKTSAIAIMEAVAAFDDRSGNSTTFKGEEINNSSTTLRLAETNNSSTTLKNEETNSNSTTLKHEETHVLGVNGSFTTCSFSLLSLKNFTYLYRYAYRNVPVNATVLSVFILIRQF